MGMCNLNLPHLFRFTNWVCCNVGKKVFINLQCFFSAFYPNGIDSLPSDSCCFLGFKTQVKVFSIIPRTHISAEKVNDSLNPCCQGCMGVKLSCV